MIPKFIRMKIQQPACISLKFKLDNFFHLLKTQAIFLKLRIVYSMHFTSSLILTLAIPDVISDMAYGIISSSL